MKKIVQKMEFSHKWKPKKMRDTFPECISQLKKLPYLSVGEVRAGSLAIRELERDAREFPQVLINNIALAVGILNGYIEVDDKRKHQKHGVEQHDPNISQYIR